MLNKSLCVHFFPFPPFDIVQTANRFMPASNPYNPYFGPGLLPMMGHPEHAAAAAPQAMSLATNAGTQPQKRNVQVMAVKCFSRLLLVLCAALYLNKRSLCMFYFLYIFILRALSKTKRSRKTSLKKYVSFLASIEGQILSMNRKRR